MYNIKYIYKFVNVFKFHPDTILDLRVSCLVDDDSIPTFDPIHIFHCGLNSADSSPGDVGIIGLGITTENNLI